MLPDSDIVLATVTLGGADSCAARGARENIAIAPCRRLAPDVAATSLSVAASILTFARTGDFPTPGVFFVDPRKRMLAAAISRGCVAIVRHVSPSAAARHFLTAIPENSFDYGFRVMAVYH